MNLLSLFFLLLISNIYAVETESPIITATFQYINFVPPKNLKSLFLLTPPLVANFLGYPLDDFNKKYGSLFEKIAKVLETNNEISAPIQDYQKQLNDENNSTEILEFDNMTFYLFEIIDLLSFLTDDSDLVSVEKPPLNVQQKIQRWIRFAWNSKTFSYQKILDDNKSHMFLYQPIFSSDGIKIIFINVSGASSIKEAQSKIQQKIDYLIKSGIITKSEKTTLNLISFINSIKQPFKQFFHKSPQ